jgi:FKBP-type peptidyl-prolyl cis-trans isomerase 2
VSLAARVINGCVTSWVKDKTIIVDFNYPLLGKIQNFDAKVIDFKIASEQKQILLSLPNAASFSSHIARAL